METRIENIFRDKHYVELSTEELMLVQEWAGSEEEFIKVKSIIIAAKSGISNLKPNANTKTNLDMIFKEKYRKKYKAIIFQPLSISVISVAAVLIFIFWLWPTNKPMNLNRIAKNQKNKIENRKTSPSIKIGTDAKEAERLETPIQIAKNEKSVVIKNDNPVAPVFMESLNLNQKEVRLVHSDFLKESNLMEGRTELTRENLLIFNVLHTSF
jgi:hypothetical protein